MLDSLINNFTSENFAEGDLSGMITRELLARKVLAMSNFGKFKDPIDVLDPLQYVGDPRDLSFLYRISVRRDFY